MLELKKPSNELIEVAQKFLSLDTQLIQMSYEKRPFERAESAPFYHNFLYALILLKTKQRPQIEEGLDLLKRLFHFQIDENENKGNFPRYLHQYPFCDRKFEIVDILLPLYWIYKDFHQIFSKELKAKLSEILEKGVACLVEVTKNQTFSYLLSVQVFCLLKAYGKLLNRHNWQEIGDQGFEKVFSQGVNKAWGSTRHLSKMILYLSLIEDSNDLLYLQPFWNFLFQSWHQSLRSYCGAGLNDHFYQEKSEQTIYHYFMSMQLEQKLPVLLDADLMETTLLTPFKITNFSPPLAELHYFLAPFEITQHSEESFSYSYFNLASSEWEKRGGFYPFRLLMKGANSSVDHFLLQMGTYCQMSKLSSKKIEISFSDSGEADLDISFYINLSSGVQILSNGGKARLFDTGYPIEFVFKFFKIKLTCPDQVPNGGVWMQLQQDNSRSQIVKEFNETYDWHLYFRKSKNHLASPFKIHLEIMEQI